MRDVIIDIVTRYVDPKIRRAGQGNISVKCPFHTVKDGTPFSVSVETGVFHCFTCHVAGTIPTMLAMLGVPQDVIEAELGPIRQAIKTALEDRKQNRIAQYFIDNPFRAKNILSEAIIAAYDWCPTPLIESGFDVSWLRYLQVGVDMRNRRITYPVRDIYGNLAGFVGGRTDKSQEPKYRVYAGQQKAYDGTTISSDYGPWFDEDYPGYEFKSHDYLWNYDKVYPRLLFGKEPEPLIVVEGFKACMWMLQCGFRNTVALMGSSMSFRQKELLLRVDARIILFLDNNEAGQLGTYKIGNTLQQAVPTVWVAKYPPGAGSTCQPDDLESELARDAVTNADQFRNWKRERNFI